MSTIPVCLQLGKFGPSIASLLLQPTFYSRPESKLSSKNKSGFLPQKEDFRLSNVDNIVFTISNDICELSFDDKVYAR